MYCVISVSLLPMIDTYSFLQKLFLTIDSYELRLDNFFFFAISCSLYLESGSHNTR